MIHFTVGLLNQDLESQKAHRRQDEDVTQASQKAKAFQTKAECLRNALAKSKTSMSVVQSNLAKAKANLVLARADLELERQR